MVTMIFALLGFLSPANRGGLMTAMLLLFAFMGILAGYYAAKLYKAFKGTEWKQMTIRTAVLFPGNHSIYVVDFLTIVALWMELFFTN